MGGYFREIAEMEPSELCDDVAVGADIICPLYRERSFFVGGNSETI